MKYVKKLLTKQKYKTTYISLYLIQTKFTSCSICGTDCPAMIISSVIWDTAMSSRTLLWIRLIFRYGWKMLVFLSAIENWIYSSPWFLPMVRFSHFPSLRIPDSGYRGLLQSSLFLSRLRDSPKAVIRYISR